MAGDMFAGLAEAMVTMFIVAIIVAGVVAIGLEHLVIYLWHHLSLHWS